MEHGPGKISCRFWILSVLIIICVVGMIVYVFVAKWYPKRHKDEDYDLHATVEATYYRMLENRELDNQELDPYVIIDETPT